MTELTLLLHGMGTHAVLLYTGAVVGFAVFVGALAASVLRAAR